MKKRRLILLLAAVAVILAVGGYYRYWRYNLKRFDVVEPGVLYRTGLPSEHGFSYLVRQRGVKTVICLLPEDPKIKGGWFFDWDRESRPPESAVLENLGVRFVHWPVSGDQIYWPWLQPDQFDAFFRLFDEPGNLPAAVHCLQGRHRTGTCVALFRLEYDRWDVERTLAEMYSYDFGPAVRLQEHHLRTYLPRPRPDAVQFGTLRTALGGLLAGKPPADYEDLVRRLRKLGDTDRRATAVAEYLKAGQPFGICLASRLIDTADDRFVPAATECARRCLESARSTFGDRAIAAAVLADYGSPAEQSWLLELLDRERRTEQPTPLYQALVAGATNRYTPNRIAYLRPLLSDNRFRPEPSACKYRYCDTAAARLATITNERFFANGSAMDRAIWDAAVRAARRWFDERPESARPGLRLGQGTTEENDTRDLPHQVPRARERTFR